MTHSYDGDTAVYKAHEQNHNLLCDKLSMNLSSEISFITKCKLLHPLQVDDNIDLQHPTHVIVIIIIIWILK